MTLPPLASVADLEARTGVAYEGVELARVGAALNDASALVREEARRDWVDVDGVAITAPASVVTVVVSAALRVIRNPEGLVSETVGPFSRRLADGEVGVYLTDPEKEIVRRYRQTTPGLWTLPTTRGEASTTVWWYDQYGTEPFPLDTLPPEVP